MPLNKGDFVLVEYTLKVKESGEVIDTTSKEVAEKAGIYDPKERYGPRLVIVGEGRLIKGLEEAIEKLDEGQETKVVIPPEKGYGKRDPNNIKVMNKSQFLRSGVYPEPGKVVEINGKLAIIRSVTGGRVIVDFNHPLAGKTLEAEVKVVRVLRSVPEKVKHLLLRRLPPVIGDEDIDVEYVPEEKYVRVHFNEKALVIQEMQTVKRIVVNEIGRFMRPEVEKIDFIEHVKFVSKKPEETQAEEGGEKAGEASGESSG